jgi:hypothetical protein
LGCWWSRRKARFGRNNLAGAALEPVHQQSQEAECRQVQAKQPDLQRLRLQIATMDKVISIVYEYERTMSNDPPLSATTFRDLTNN